MDTDESATSARLYLSISHSRRYAAAAVAPEHCGIDLCDLADADRVIRTARRMFTPAELDIGFLDDPWLAVTAWAIKEAAAKQARTSIFGPTATSTDLAEIDPPRMTTGRRVTVFRLPGTALTLVLGPTSAAPPSLSP